MMDSGDKTEPRLREQIVARARELGFDLCRFARADAPPHAREFRQWLRRIGART